jgi:hypothetical protein
VVVSPVRGASVIEAARDLSWIASHHYSHVDEGEKRVAAMRVLEVVTGDKTAPKEGSKRGSRVRHRRKPFPRPLKCARRFAFGAIAKR